MLKLTDDISQFTDIYTDKRQKKKIIIKKKKKNYREGWHLCILCFPWKWFLIETCTKGTSLQRSPAYQDHFFCLPWVVFIGRFKCNIFHFILLGIENKGYPLWTWTKCLLDYRYLAGMNQGLGIVPGWTTCLPNTYQRVGIIQSVVEARF